MVLRGGDASDFELLPDDWSDTDQRIFECLLLAQPPGAPVTSDTRSAASSGSAKKNERKAAAGAGTRRKKATVQESSAVDKNEKPPRRYQQQLSQQKEYTGKSATKKRKATRRRTSLDERKFKHREVQRRFMERKKESIVRVKQVAAGLESQFRLLQLTSEKETLEQENTSLRELFTDSEVPSLEQLKLLLEDEKKIVESNFQPVTVKRWHELVEHVMEEIDSQAADPAFRSVGFSVLGWSDRRKVEDSAVKFTFSKFFAHIWAEELLNKTWTKLTTESYASFFSPALYVTVHLLQKVSDDAIIVYRAICNPATNRISRSVELIGRIRRERDFVLFIRNFDGAYAVHRSVGEPKSWSRSLSILRFEPTSVHQTSPGCIVHSGGVYSNLVTGGVQHWLMEVLFLVLRFESSMIQPVFTICNA